MNARGVKGKKRKRIGRLRDKGQSESFIKAAKDLGLDQSGETFERALDSLLKPKGKRGSS